MHYLYEKHVTQEGFEFRFKEERSLAGRVRGMIPHLLEINLNEVGNEPLFWHFVVEDEINKSRWPGCTLVIDLKPSGAKLSLYEITEAWGVSDKNWTPMMLRLRSLTVDKESTESMRQKFTVRRNEIQDPIFTFMYMNGTVKDGAPVGQWTFPPRSSTNSVLLWPGAFDYFCREAQSVIKGD